MATQEIHENDVGTTFVVTLTDSGTAIDISGATTKQLILQDPDGSKSTKTATFTTDGTDGKIQYTTTTTDDLDGAGNWKIQARIADNTNDWKSQIGAFIVYDNL